MAKVMVAMYCFDYPDDYNDYDDEDTGFVSNDKLLKASLLCDKFRVLDLETLIIDDYSFRDVVEIRDEIVNLHLGEVSEESLDNGYEYFNLIGCTQSFIDSEFGYDKTGKLAVPNDCNFIPISYKGKISEEGDIVYVGDTLAVCGKCSSSSKDSILKNGVKYVYIAVGAREQVLVIPPTVEEIRISCNWWHYLCKLNYIKLILPKVKLDSLVSKLAKGIDLSKFGYLVTLEEKVEALRKTYVLIETYG